MSDGDSKRAIKKRSVFATGDGDGDSDKTNTSGRSISSGHTIEKSRSRSSSSSSSSCRHEGEDRVEPLLKCSDCGECESACCCRGSRGKRGHQGREGPRGRRGFGAPIVEVAAPFNVPPLGEPVDIQVRLVRPRFGCETADVRSRSASSALSAPILAAPPLDDALRYWAFSGVSLYIQTAGLAYATAYRYDRTLRRYVLTVVFIPAIGNADPGYLVLVGALIIVAGGRGPAGATGAQGPCCGGQGMAGPQGPCCPGATGAQGSSGAQGGEGVTGAQGAAGATGVQGVGATGAQGGTGTQGGQGATGNQGNVGPQGGVGATGATGATSAQGSQGEQGDVGAQGNAGSQGQTGAQGNTGVQGPAGNTGVQGPAGTQGNQGNTGAQGMPGDFGPQGFTGLTGAIETGFGYVVGSSSVPITVAAGNPIPYGSFGGTAPVQSVSGGVVTTTVPGMYQVVFTVLFNVTAFPVRFDGLLTTNTGSPVTSVIGGSTIVRPTGATQVTGFFNVFISNVAVSINPATFSIVNNSSSSSIELQDSISVAGPPPADTASFGFSQLIINYAGAIGF